MSYRSLAAVSLLTLASVAAGQQTEEHETEKIEAPEVPDDSGKRPDLAEVAKAVVEQTNAFRKKEGRDPVATDAKLAATARYFAGYMARTDEYGHRADGKGPGERVKAHGYDYCLVAENIAYAFDSRGFDAGRLATRLVTGWENSPPHRKNMLDPDVAATGVAVARSEKTGHYYAVQLFGRPKSAAVVFAVANRAGEDVSYTIGGKTFELPPRVTRTHTQCRPAELTFHWPGGKTAVVKTSGKDRFVVTKGENGFAVAKE